MDCERLTMNHVKNEVNTGSDLWEPPHGHEKVGTRTSRTEQGYRKVVKLNVNEFTRSILHGYFNPLVVWY